MAFINQLFCELKFCDFILGGRVIWSFLIMVGDWVTELCYVSLCIVGLQQKLMTECANVERASPYTSSERCWGTYLIGLTHSWCCLLNIHSNLFFHPSSCKPQSSIMGLMWVFHLYLIYLLTAIGLSPNGSSTVHIYTQTIHRMIQNKQYIEQHNNFGRVRAVPRLG